MAKKKLRHPPTVMKNDDVAYRKRLLERWDFLCVVCGREFMNLACVTKEHVIPRSVHSSQHMKFNDNLAPSHYRCNKLRGSGSIIEVAKLIDEKSKTMFYHDFVTWLNTPIPNRIVPKVALQPLRALQCLELPETLPGLL